MIAKAAGLTQDAADVMLWEAGLRAATGAGLAPSTHHRLVNEYILWYALNVTIWLSIVCDSHPDREPLRAKEFRHYLKGINLI